MKNILIVIIVTLFSAEIFGQKYSSERDRSSLGVGYQLSYPFSGISLIVAPEMDFSFQAMFGVIGEYKSYCGKIRYHFGESTAFAYALIGARDEETSISIGDGSVRTRIDMVLGYGIGLGIEYQGPGTPLWINFEVGYGKVNYKAPSKNNHATMFGVGLHFYFPESIF